MCYLHFNLNIGMILNMVKSQQYKKYQSACIRLNYV